MLGGEHLDKRRPDMPAVPQDAALAAQRGNVANTAAAVMARRKHQLTLKARENLSVDGVIRVESFDESEVILETDQGGMIVRGDNLHIKELNLEAGTMHVDGTVHILQYTGDTMGQKSKGFIARLFR
jgi:sporulation protein YabP